MEQASDQIELKKHDPGEWKPFSSAVSIRVSAATLPGYDKNPDGTITNTPNEDAFLCQTRENSDKTTSLVLAVADGASKARGLAGRIVDNVAREFGQGNNNISQLANEAGENNLGLASTFTGCVIYQSKTRPGRLEMKVYHAGDSRLYLIRNGKIHQITNDEEGQDFKLLNAVGVDGFSGAQLFGEYIIGVGDVVIVCSDGANKPAHVMTNQKILEIVQTTRGKEEIAQVIAETARKNALLGAHVDDVSMIVLEIADRQMVNPSNSAQEHLPTSNLSWRTTERGTNIWGNAINPDIYFKPLVKIYGSDAVVTIKGGNTPSNKIKFTND